MAALLALVPLKDWIYVAVIAAILAGGTTAWLIHDRHEQSLGAAHELAAVQAASKAATAQAQKTIAALNATHQTEIAKIQDSENEQLKAAAADSASLSQRLRNYESRGRCPNPVLGNPTAPASSAASSTGSAGGAQGGAVERALEQLIAAAEHDNAVIEAERAERDSLTGK